jgi:hypothetical protein|tara:strand:- start:3051 stop:3332 length:282 start_codon:yes stop_codon:yes gene_type:complete
MADRRTDMAFSPVELGATAAETTLDKSDPPTYWRKREALTREKWVEVAAAKLLSEELSDCYRREGVNHIQNCRDLAEQYMAAVSKPGFGIKKP